MEKLANKTFNNGTSLKIDKPRGYTLKIVDVSINDFAINNKRKLKNYVFIKEEN